MTVQQFRNDDEVENAVKGWLNDQQNKNFTKRGYIVSECGKEP